MTYIAVILLNLILIGPVMSKTLNIFILKSSEAPYHIHADALVLSTFNAAVVGQLIRNDDGFNLKPGHLENFSYDFKREKYILKLRKGITFHNGRTATAKDLEFSLLRGFYSKDRSFFHVYLGNIKGLEAIKPGDKFKSGAVSGIKIIDDLTVEVTLKSPNPSFFHSLTVPYFSLFPREELKDDYLTWKALPIGAGNYRVVSPGFDGNKTIIELISGKGDEKQPSRVIFHNEFNDEIDLVEQRESLIGFKPFISDKPATIRVISYSNKNELSLNSHFKKWLNHIIDRKIFASDDSSITEATELLPSHFWGRTNDKSQFDEKIANEHFKKIPKNLLDKSYEFAVFSGPKLSKRQLYYTTKLESEFKKYGFKAKFVPLEEKFVSKASAQKYPIYMWGIVCDYIDPLVTFSAFKENGHLPHHSPIGEELVEYERLYTHASNATSFDERNNSVKDLSKFVKDNAVVSSITEEKISYQVRSSTIESLGVQSHPVTLFVENIRMK